MLSIRTAPGSGATGRRNIKSRCILFSLLFFISSSGLNAAPGDSTITLTNAVQRALSQNPSLKVFPYRYAALQGQAETAGCPPGRIKNFMAGSWPSISSIESSRYFIGASVMAGSFTEFFWGSAAR